MAFAALGAAEVADVLPDHQGARELLADAVTVIGRGGSDPAWPWPEPRLEYADAALPEAIIAAGQYLGDEAILRDGLALLDWLLSTATRDGHLSPTPRAAGAWANPAPASTSRPSNRPPTRTPAPAPSWSPATAAGSPASACQWIGSSATTTAASP
ncbi:hypothetical protein ACFQ9X_42940 [Catenulispora yoronensis]